MKAQSFSIFKRADRACYSVSFKDSSGKYLPPVSTGKRTEKEAAQEAQKMLSEGIPQKNKADNTTVADLSLKDMIRKIKSFGEAKMVLDELKRQGWAKSFVMRDTEQSEDFIQFMKNFWEWETSAYVKEKLRKNHGIHKKYCKGQYQAIELHWEPYFKNRFIGDITAADVDAFIAHMGEKGISPGRKNVVIKAGIRPLRWAFSKNIIDHDPTRGHIMFSENTGKREILTPTVAALVFKAIWKEERSRLANMLASVTGMRSGEIAALRLQDLGPDCIYVRKSYNYIDGLKRTKNNEIRTVEIPFPDLVERLVKQANQNPWGAAPGSFVFWSEKNKAAPMDANAFRVGFRIALVQAGFTKEQADKYMFHSWRHFYTSYMAPKLDKKLLKTQTGHKTDTMIDHYSNHETVGDRELIKATAKETFAGVLPQKVLLLEYKGKIAAA